MTNILHNTRMRNISVLLLMFAIASACNNMGGNETRTFPLRQLSSNDALMLVEGYVPGNVSNVRRSDNPRALTITAPTSRLDQIAQVLAKYDKPAPNVQLEFQIIEADGFTTKDSAIADVESALRGVFKFQGYRLVASATVITHAPGRFQQIVSGGYTVEGQVTSEGSADATNLEVWMKSGEATILGTTVTVPNGQVVVLGSSRPDPSKPTIILVVRTKIM